MSSVFYSQYFSIVGYLMGASVLCSFLFSFILMGTSKGLYFKMEKDTNSCLIPVYNLFVLNEGLNINPALTVLYFVPFVNLGFYVYICYKIGYYFRQNYDFTLGLVFFPYVFYYILSNNKSQLSMYEEELREKENEEVLNDILLVTDKKLKEMNDSEGEETEKVDSIFKSHIERDADAPIYKASNVKTERVHLDFDLIDGKHKIIFIPSPRVNQVKEDIIKKVETSYIGSADKVNTRHEDEIGIYEIK